LKIKGDASIALSRSVLNFGMGANNLTSSGEYQDSGVVRFERDVLARDKIKWLVVMEGINDIVYGNVQAQPIISAYQEIISRAHDEGILVYGSPMTPTDQGSASVRNEVNDWIRTSGEFDGVIDLDKAVDPNDTGAIAAQFNNDGLHPNVAGYEAMGNAVDLSLFYDSTLQ
jgi:lysophospholipase L1-like esterase